jgi:hypothetical protein
MTESNTRCTHFFQKPCDEKKYKPINAYVIRELVSVTEQRATDRTPFVDYFLTVISPIDCVDLVDTFAMRLPVFVAFCIRRKQELWHVPVFLPAIQLINLVPSIN